jgi:polyisoprenoid-binding protein YceI
MLACISDTHKDQNFVEPPVTPASHSLTPTSLTAIAGAWTVVAEHSHARFVATTFGGAVKVPGAFGSPSGHLVVDAEGARGVLEIDAATIDTGIRLRDRHLRGRDFFAVAKHPQLRYEMRSLTQTAGELVGLQGELLVAGKRTALPLEATVRPLADGGLEIACRTTVDRVALGIRGARAMVPRAVELDVVAVLRLRQ